MNKRLPEIFKPVAKPVNDTKAEKQRIGSEALSEESYLTEEGNTF